MARKTELCPTYTAGTPVTPRPSATRGFSARFAAVIRRHVCTRIVRGTFARIAFANGGCRWAEGDPIRNTIVIDRGATTLSALRVSSRVIFKSLSTHKYARSSVRRRAEFIDPTFGFAKLCQHAIVFRAARYRGANTNSRDFTTSRAEVPSLPDEIA